MSEITELRGEIEAIKKRNLLVEGEKAWETSYIRRGILTAFTYLAIGIYLFIINVPKPWLNAIIPAIAFMLSTLTLPFFRSIWLKHVYRR
jgi:hypothetical protein